MAALEDISFDEIIGGIYLGPGHVAVNQHNRLKDVSVSAIINVTRDLSCAFPNDFKYHHIEVSDEVDEPIHEHFEAAAEFVAERRGNNEIVFVHCHAGVSRSSTIVIYLLMTLHKMTLRDAYTLVRQKRSCISPNVGFFRQLCEAEKRLFGVTEASYPSEQYNEDALVTVFEGVDRSLVRECLQEAKGNVTQAQDALMKRLFS